MPRSNITAAMITELNRQGGFGMITLLDVLTVDGTAYYFSEIEGIYPAKIGGGNQTYLPWLKSCGPFRRTRDGRTDAGDIVLQNLSGNTIEREVQKTVGIHEYEGAFAVVRFWNLLLQDIADEFHGTLTEQIAPEDEVSFRMVQLIDAAQYDTAPQIIADRCQLRYKGTECGSAGAAVACNKLFPTCIDANHAASERFRGVLTVTPGALIYDPPVDTGLDPGGGRDGDDRELRGEGGGGIRRGLEL
jgi:phage-related protein